MLFRHLRYLLAVFEEGSLAKAALRLNVVQPALSRQLRDLELSLGDTLFLRHPTGVTPTAAGLRLEAPAREVLARLAHLVERTRRADRGDAATIRIALSPQALGCDRVTAPLAKLHGRMESRFEAVEAYSTAHAEGLRRGDFDLTIGLESREIPGIRSTTIFTDPICCAILPEGHRLTHVARLSVRDLAREPLLHYDRQAKRFFPDLVRAISKAGLTISERHDSYDALIWNVAAGRGWALGLGSQLASPPLGTTVVRLDGFNVPCVMAARTRATDRSPAINRVIRFLRGDGDAVDSMPVASESVAVATSRLELRHLHGALAVAREGSISKAARRVRLTPSGMSRQVQALEAMLGARLFDRVGPAMIPTVAGRAFLEEVAGVTALADGLATHVHGRSAPPTGRCRVAMVATGPARTMMLELVRAFAIGLPQLRVEVVEMQSPAIVKGVRAGHIDVGICSASFVPITEDLESAMLHEDEINCALVAASHRLAAARRLTVDDLHDEPFIFFRRADNPRLHDSVFREIEALGAGPRVLVTAASARAVQGMVAAATGWSLGLRSQLSSPPSGTVAVPLQGFSLPIGIQLLWRSVDTRSETRAVVAGLTAQVEARRAAESADRPRAHGT